MVKSWDDAQVDELMVQIKVALAPTPPPQKVRASHYDIARTDLDNAKQWDHADNFDADKANDPGTRQTARNRSRAETDNNPSLKGITRTIRDYEVGPGPTLHVDHDNTTYAADVAKRWGEWCEATGFVGKLEQMVCGRFTDGESFARLGINPGLNNPVKLDVQPFECDRCYTLWLPYLTPNRIDGVWFDSWGNPTYYDILQFHPGGVFPMPSWKFDTVPAQYVLHLFRPERANQHRGMPELSSSTELFADRRRFRKATVGAAETAANIGGFLTTDQPAEEGFAPAENSITAFPRNSLVIAPNQYDLKQIDAKHPSQTYEAFSRETLGEAARPASMALNVAKCDSSTYNFAGGRLDIITSWKAVEGNQRNNTHRVVNPVFRAWYVEARLVHGWTEIDKGEIPAHTFLWCGMPYSDPEAEQGADEQGVATGMKGLQDIYARRGKDWIVERRKNARAVGMTEDEYTRWILGNLSKNQGGAPVENKTDGQQSTGSTADSGATEGAGGKSEPAAAPAAKEAIETPAEVEAKAAAFWSKYLPGLARRLNGHSRPAKLRASASPFIEVPDIRQDTNFRCGAAAAMCVGRYFGVGPDTLDDWADDLGTTAAQSTSPEAIVSYLSALGLKIDARQNMSVDDLERETAAGRPVICCCQDYVSQDDDPRSDQAEWDYGHWVTCIGVIGQSPHRYLVFQDSSIENMERLPGGDVPQEYEDDERVVQAPGRVLVRESEWLPAWHDQAVNGVLFDHYGISVGLAETATPTAALIDQGAPA